jgi:bifunctional non-homologous end joining protein LigD
MVLEKYKQKRNFTSTPEPAGDAALAAERARTGAGAGLFFCVQKHLASHLHYDLRLEHEGVLLSWAVPKGPSLDPGTKRLAMHVEDHPVEYGTFEGVIPEGYGAGIVMLWDQGTWIPEVEDVGAALAKGDLKFTLDGYKLKGSWVLVRTGGRYGSRPGGDARSWLLIKHRDDWAGDVDITEFAPRSVKSDGDFEDILAADRPDVWHSNRPAKGGEAGEMLAKIIERAAALKEGRAAGRAAPGKPVAIARPAAAEQAGKAARQPKGAKPAKAPAGKPGSTRPRTAKPAASRPRATASGKAANTSGPRAAAPAGGAKRQGGGRRQGAAGAARSARKADTAERKTTKKRS